MGTPSWDAPAFVLCNMLTVARLIAESALCRRESRGAHFRSDVPETDDANWRCRIVSKPVLSVRVMLACRRLNRNWLTSRCRPQLLAVKKKKSPIRPKNLKKK